MKKITLSLFIVLLFVKSLLASENNEFDNLLQKVIESEKNGTQQLSKDLLYEEISNNPENSVLFFYLGNATSQKVLVMQDQGNRTRFLTNERGDMQGKRKKKMTIVC